jgi:hypothetical protein
MKLDELEARRLVELRLAGLSHAQAIRRIKMARPAQTPSPAQLRHRARAAAALKLSQELEVSLARGWELLEEPAGFDGPAFGIRAPQLPGHQAHATTSKSPIKKS